MSEIKTAKQRIHKLEGGEGDSFVTFEQALIAENNELRAKLMALEGKEVCAGKNCGSTNPRLHSADCFAQHDASIGLDKPFGYFEYVLDDGDGYWRECENEEGMPLYAAAAAASEWNDFVEIACARIKSADDAAADGDYMLDSSDCIKVLRGTWGGNYLNDHPVLPAAGAAPVPDMLAGWIRACDDEMISAHLGVANLSDSYESAKAKLRMLIDWHVAVAVDPAVNGGYQLVPVEALTRWRDAFSEELSAWDIDPPLHHMQTSHDEISAILVAAPKEPT